MPELSKETIQVILADIRQDAMKIQQLVDFPLMNNPERIDYKDMDMLHYVAKSLESKVRILRGYN